MADEYPLPERLWATVAGIQPSGRVHGIWDQSSERAESADWRDYVRADLGSFYQEKDIDALMACRDALRRLVDAQDCGAPDTDPIHPRLWKQAREALANMQPKEPK